MIKYLLIFVGCFLIGFAHEVVTHTEKVTAFVRVKNEIKTIEACLESIDGVFDRIVIIHSNEPDDGSAAFMNQWCGARSYCEIYEYPHAVIPPFDPRYGKGAYKWENSLAAYYNFGLDFFDPEEWVFKIDADQVYVKNRLRHVVAYIKSQGDTVSHYYSIEGYNTFVWRGRLVLPKHFIHKGYKDHFVIKRKYFKSFEQKKDWELASFVEQRPFKNIMQGVFFHYGKFRERDWEHYSHVAEIPDSKIIHLEPQARIEYDRFIRPLFSKTGSELESVQFE